MNRKYVKWLHAELPILVERSVITEESARKIAEYYGDVVETGTARRVILPICAAFGSLLIGAGIILLIAHNWEMLSRPARAALAIGPLAVANLLGFWTIWTNRRSQSWQEGISSGICLSLAASIALVGQTYHVGGDLNDFLLSWLIFSIPILYTFNGIIPLLLYLAGITAWAGCQSANESSAHLFWILAAAAVPRLIMDAGANLYSARTAWETWFAMSCLALGLGFTMKWQYGGLWTVAFASLFSLYYLAGRLLYQADQPALLMPLQTGGATAIALLSFMLTFEFVWKEMSHTMRYLTLPHGGYENIVAVAILFLLYGLSALEATRRLDRSAILYGCAPAVALATWSGAIQFTHIPLGQVAYNAYVLILGVGTLVAAVRKERLGLLNAGMVLLAALTVSRFFDLDLGFVARGIVFIAIGAAFLMANIIMARRFRTGGSK